MSVPVIIPSYEPDSRLVALLKDIRDKGNSIDSIIIVDDGSGAEYRKIFDEAKAVIPDRCTVLIHDFNKGKGAALKTAFKYVIENMKDAIGCITADSDGQHDIECIEAVMEKFLDNPDNLILGVRNFDCDNIPWKNYLGNKLTIKVMQYASGLKVSDTQTGLRGIPATFMKELLDVKSDRFEFETQMLLNSYGNYSIIEVPIKTIYDSKEKHQTHFNPIVDSIKIYRILGKKILAYIFSSCSSGILDLILFAISCRILKTKENYIAVSTILARVISATYNYAINYRVVFKSAEPPSKAAIKYIVLACALMTISAILVTVLTGLLYMIPEVFVKAIVDTLLFFVSYYIQDQYVFKYFN